jgi:FkbM family methyltransferase
MIELPKVSLVQGNSGKFLLFEGNDFISQNIVKFGIYENVTHFVSQTLIDATVKPVVLDIGANLGSYSIPIAKYINEKSGKVFAFEPQRITYYQLCGNIILNSLNNVTAYNSAVGANPNTLTIPEIDYNKCDNVGAFSLEGKFREKHGLERSLTEEMFEVPVVTLDSLSFGEPPTLIKIDVEGFEIKVLQGALNFLKNCKYPPIIFECWSFDWFAEERKELFSLIEDLGYTFTEFVDDTFVAQHKSSHALFDFVRGENTLQFTRVK